MKKTDKINIKNKKRIKTIKKTGKYYVDYVKHEEAINYLIKIFGIKNLAKKLKTSIASVYRWICQEKQPRDLKNKIKFLDFIKKAEKKLKDDELEEFRDDEII